MTRLFAREGPWLFSRAIDLGAFGGSALAAWLLVLLGWPLGLLDADAPTWTFFGCVIAVDVAHVWSMGFRSYFDGEELRARPLLYLGVPLAAYLIGVGLHAFGSRVFWGALAYLAVFHFVRQQAGFLRLYARRNPAQTRLDTLLEQAAMYASMLVPLIAWHARLPRAFAWLIEGDFVSVEAVGVAAARIFPLAAWANAACLLGFTLRQAYLLHRGAWVPGKSVLMTATASCWWLGIVVFDSDYVFTVTNVLIHGVPYFVLTQRYARARGAGWAGRVALRGLVPVLLICLTLAVAEEALWDRWVWHERPEYFGEVFPLSPVLMTFLVPLLALPQASHYVLDGFLWRVRRENLVLRRELESG
ncbi:MAG: hypothetical protein ABW352_10815 [Polyangiales bacterium]